MWGRGDGECAFSSSRSLPKMIPSPRAALPPRATIFRLGCFNVLTPASLESTVARVFGGWSGGVRAANRRRRHGQPIRVPADCIVWAEVPLAHLTANLAPDRVEPPAAGADTMAFSITPENTSVNENSPGFIDFTVSRTPSTGTEIVYFSTILNGGANTNDYTSIVDRQLTFSPGVSSQTVRVFITPDSEVEPNQTYRDGLFQHHPEPGLQQRWRLHRSRYRCDHLHPRPDFQDYRRCRHQRQHTGEHRDLRRHHRERQRPSPRQLHFHDHRQ